MNRYSPSIMLKIRHTALTVFTSAASFFLLGVTLSGCASLKGREVTLRPSRLTVLESHDSQLASIKRIGIAVRKCPQSIDADTALRSAIGGATTFEIVDSGKGRDRSIDTLTVECTTAVERDGGELGASRPAAIGLLANLTSSNEVVWSARYFYRDRDVSTDVLALKDRMEVGGGGVRFASLSELAHSGLVEISEALGQSRSASMIAK